MKMKIFFLTTVLLWDHGLSLGFQSILPNLSHFSFRLKDGVPQNNSGIHYSHHHHVRRAGTRIQMKFKKSVEDIKSSVSPTGKEETSLLLVVIPLLFIYISNQWSRSSLYYLVDFSTSDTSAFTAMNQDLGFSQAQYGFLASVAFTALFALASLFAGGLADRFDRKALTIGSACMWSIATFTTAISHDFNQVLISRILMGLACAFATPSAYTLIRDLVPKGRAALANSIYGSAVYLGGSLSSLSILLDEKIGWRGTCDAVAIFGLLSATISIFFLPSDPKNITSAELKEAEIQLNFKKIETENQMFDTKEESLISNVGDVLSKPRVQWLFAGSFFRFCSGLCIGVWAAPYFRLAFPMYSEEYAVTNALIIGICGVISGLIGGYAADELSPVTSKWGWDENAGRLIIPIIGSTLAAPAWWFTAHASTFDFAMIWLAIEYLIAECWFGPTVAVLQSEVGKSKGGVAQGLFTVSGAIGNLAPSLIGFVYLQLQNTDVSNDGIFVLSNILSYAVSIGYLLSAACFFMSASTSPNQSFNAKTN